VSVRLGIIGGGIMGEAILSRLFVRGAFAPEEVLVSDPSAARRSALSDRYGVATTGDNRATLSATETLLLAIKPQVFDKVTAALGLATGDRATETAPLVLSILAGMPLARLEAGFPKFPVVRAMPNANATVGAGMAAIAPGQLATAEHLECARTILAAVGQVVEVPETLLDAVTGLSGSGPAYVAVFIEALADGGVAAGLPRAIARQLALQTVLGTAQQLQETELHPGEFKDRVTSPGGTTIAGVAALEQAGFRSAAIQAVQAAAARSRELGRG